MKAGQLFQRRDNPLQVVISENLAARLWPGENAVGRPLRNYGQDKPHRVSGVVGAVHAGSLTAQPTMIVYPPSWQAANSDMSLAIRTETQPDALAGAVRKAVTHLEGQAAIPNIDTMEAIEAASVAPRHFQMVLLLMFALAVLTLACLGIYAVLSFATSNRTPEIGIRMAMGARPGQILQMTLQRGLTPVLFGIVLELSISAGLTKVIQELLFGVQALDPFMYIAVAFTLLSAAALACSLPARRAARLNPVEALKHT